MQISIDVQPKDPKRPLTDDLVKSRILLKSQGQLQILVDESRKSLQVVGGGNMVLKRLSMQEHEKIITGCLGEFYNGQGQRRPPYDQALAVLSDQYLSLFFLGSGTEHTVAIPFTVKELYPMAVGPIAGIMLERLEASNDFDVPILFTLLHPTEEIKPVFIRSGNDQASVTAAYKLMAAENMADLSRLALLTATNEVHVCQLKFDETYDEDLSIYMNFEFKSQIYLEISAKISLPWMPENVFFVQSINGKPLIWALNKQHKSLTAFDTETSQTVFNYTVLSACKISETKLLLVLPDNSIALWNGYERLLHCETMIKGLYPDSKRTFSQSEEAEIKKKSTTPKKTRSRRILDISCDGIVIKVEFSDQTLGIVSMNSNPHSSLVDACLKGLEYTLSDELYSTFLARFHIAKIFHTENNERDDWSAFILCFFSFLYRKLSSASVMKSKPKFQDLSTDSKQRVLSSLPKSVQKNLASTFDSNLANFQDMEALAHLSKTLHLQFHTEPNLIADLSNMITLLHYVYQDFLLDSSATAQVAQLGEFLCQICYSTKSHWTAYYEGNGHHVATKNVFLNDASLHVELPDIYQWCSDCILSGYPGKDPLEFISLFGKKDLALFNGLNRIRMLVKLYSLFFTKGPIEMVQEMAYFDQISLDSWPIALSLPIRQALFRCKDERDCLSKSVQVNKVIGRRDLVAQLDPSSFNTLFSSNSERKDVAALRFSKDDRLDRVKEMLSPSEEKTLDVTINPSMSIDEIANAQQSVLAIWANRVFALSLGRAMIDFECSDIVPTEVFAIPKIQKSARLPPLNSLIEYIVSPESDIMDWPDFHVGVSAALQIKRDCPDVTSSWIVFNQVKSTDGPALDAAHAGFIFGLGLLGHLKKLESADSLRNYFLPQFEIMSVGHLLGLAVAHLGTKHSQITNMLSVHLPSMLPSHSVELSPGSILKTGAMVGYGLVHFEHPSQYKYDKVLIEIEKLEVSDNSIENCGKDSYMIGCGFALGFIGLSKGNDACKMTTLLVNRILKHLKSAASISASQSLIIALGLICLRSNNRYVANQFQVPPNSFMLDWITPETLLIQTISRYLILWDDLEPTQEWVLSQIPSYMLDAVKDKDLSCHPKYEHIFHCYHSMVAGLCFVISLRYASSCNADAFTCFLVFLQEVNNILQSRSYSVKFGHSRKLYEIVLRNCLGCISSALAILMAGSGNSAVLKILKGMQAESGSEFSYGYHLCVNMSLGLLFLANGTATIGTSNKAIAALVCSFFPLYPKSVTDNRQHLQALRHLWVLAVENRCLVTRDVDSGKVVCVPVQIYNKTDTNLSIMTEFSPVILPEYHTISKIHIDGPRYWDIVVPIDSIKQSGNTVWVQRKSRYLSYIEDPDGQRGILSASFPTSRPLLGLDEKTSVERVQKMRERFVLSFSSSPQVLAFVQSMCDVSFTPASSHSNGGYEMSHFCTQVLYECLCEDKIEMVQVYVALFNDLKKFIHSDSKSTDLATFHHILGFKCIIEFNKRVRLDSTKYGKCILDECFVDMMSHQIDTFYEKLCNSQEIILRIRSIFTFKRPSLSDDQSRNEKVLTASLLGYLSWPGDEFVRNAVKMVIEAFKTVKEVSEPLYTIGFMEYGNGNISLKCAKLLAKAFQP